jgi:hypothetical protein
MTLASKIVLMTAASLEESDGLIMLRTSRIVMKLAVCVSDHQQTVIYQYFLAIRLDLAVQFVTTVQPTTQALSTVTAKISTES